MGGTCEPANGNAISSRPEMLVPAWRRDACSIAAAIRQARIGPGNPCGIDLDMFEATEQCRIGFGWSWCEQYGCMPGATDNGDALEAFFLGCTARLAHMGLALRLLLVF